VLNLLPSGIGVVSTVGSSEAVLQLLTLGRSEGRDILCGCDAVPEVFGKEDTFGGS
jgi:hypothetical protein